MPYNPADNPSIAGELVSVTITRPGFLGLNLQDESIDRNQGWASEALNCIISKSGEVESRKGWVKVNQLAIAGNPEIQFLHEYIKSDSSSEILSGAGNKLYTGTDPLVDITPVTPVWTANNWKAQNFIDNAYLFQLDQPVLVYDGVAVTALTAAGGFVDSSDSVITTLKPNECLSAYGRLWVGDTATNKMKLWWSDVLSPQIWSGGSSGSIDFNSVLVSGADELTAIRAWNNFLVVFFKNSIVFYQNPEVPSALQLWDTIDGIGCLARDSIQEIGTDLFFLSNSGVRSLQRTIQEKSLPVGDISKNVRDLVIDYAELTTASLIKSVYIECDAFYLISFPINNNAHIPVFCFDLRRPLDDGSYRATIWDNLKPKTFLSTRSRELYFGQNGHIGKYSGYQDNGTPYIFSYISSWLPLEIPNLKKILKRIHCLADIAKGDTLTFKWAYDYSNAFFTESIVSSNDLYWEYNIAEYGIAEYTSGRIIDDIHVPGSSSGEVVRFGISKVINGFKTSIKKIDAMFKLGRAF